MLLEWWNIRIRIRKLIFLGTHAYLRRVEKKSNKFRANTLAKGKRMGVLWFTIQILSKGVSRAYIRTYG